MAVSQPTKADLQALVDQIVTGGDYTANELRPLLTNILDSIYSPFFSSGTNPATGNNQVQNYKAGSFGVNTANGRYFVCSAADGTTATWNQITDDKGYQAIVGVASTSYQIAANASIVSFSGAQNSVILNLPIASKSYLGKVVRIYFSSPASTSGLGVTFAVPEVSPITLLAANVYTSHAFVEFTFTAGGWVLTQYVPTVSDFGFQGLLPANGGTGIILADTYLVNLTAILATAFTTYNVTLPATPYLGKVIKIQTSTNVLSIATLNIRRPDGTILASGAMGTNQAVEFIYNGLTWVKVAPTIIW